MSGYALRLIRPTSRVELVATLIMRLPCSTVDEACQTRRVYGINVASPQFKSL